MMTTQRKPLSSTGAIADFTEGGIFRPLMSFVIPVLLSLLLQFLYGAVDLWVVGRYSVAGDISGVAIGSQVMQTVSGLIIGLAGGITVQVGQLLGMRQIEKVPRTIGCGLCMFLILSGVITLVMMLFSERIVSFMNTPAEATEQALSYIRICAMGTLLVGAYNLLGAIFRGLGDSKMPLVCVAISTVLNLGGDMLFVAVLGIGAAGAALATVIAQTFSVLFSLLIIRRKPLGFSFTAKDICFDRVIIKRILQLGVPIALQNTLLNFSFMITRSFVNGFGVAASSGVGIAGKLSYIIMLFSEAYMNALSSFVAQNVGAKKMGRANRALGIAIATSFTIGLFMSYLAFFRGASLISVFTHDPDICAAGTDYLRANGLDCLITSISFCFIGYFSGCGRSKFVMSQELIGAFCIRVPVAYHFSRLSNATLFSIGLAMPISTAVQVAICLCAYIVLHRIDTKAVFV